MRHNKCTCAELLRFESVLAELSARFISVSAERLNAEIADAQQSVCECIGLDISALFQWQGDCSDLQLTNLYRSTDGPPIPEQLSAREYFPWAIRQALAHKLVAISSTDNVPDEAARDQATWQYFGLKSVLNIPLCVGGMATFGVLSFCSSRNKLEWSDLLIEQLKLVAQIFAGAIDRKRSEQALRESAMRLSLATEAADAVPWALDVQTSRFWMGTKALELFGPLPDDHIDLKSFIDQVHADDRQEVCDALAWAVQSRKIMSIEIRLIGMDGQVRWMIFRGRMGDGPSGISAWLTGIASDITELKLREESLCLSEARIATAIAVAGLGFYEMGEDNNIKFIDDRSQMLFGIPPEEVSRGQEYWLARVHPEDIPQVLRANRKMFAEGLDRCALEYRYVHPSGEMKWFHHLSNVLTRDASGGVTSLVGVVHDITERRQMEITSKKLREDIAHVTRVNTMGELTAALAHELNQPLTAIGINAHAATRMIASGNSVMEEIREILEDIIADNQRAGEVIQRVRGLVAKDPPVLRSLDMNDIIREVICLVHSEAVIKGVHISLGLSPEPLLIFSDRIQLQQVLLNLIVNSLGAMSTVQGERVLTVRTEGLSGDGVVVSVQDSGPGIPPEQIEAIFTPFFSNKPGGLGMGLSICRTIITSLGGRIRAGNAENRGAIIQFSLPVDGGKKHE